MEIENSQNVFSVSITHNSKIRKLSYGNRVMETELSFGQTTFLLWVPPFLSYELWKLRIELRKLLIQTGSYQFCCQSYGTPGRSHNIHVFNKAVKHFQVPSKQKRVTFKGFIWSHGQKCVCIYLFIFFVQKFDEFFQRQKEKVFGELQQFYVFKFS